MTQNLAEKKITVRTIIYHCIYIIFILGISNRIVISVFVICTRYKRRNFSSMPKSPYFPSGSQNTL